MIVYTVYDPYYLQDGYYSYETKAEAMQHIRDARKYYRALRCQCPLDEDSIGKHVITNRAELAEFGNHVAQIT